MKNSQEKFQDLRQRMKSYAKEDVMLAFSGGVDSSFLLWMVCEQARVYGTKVYAVNLQTMLHPSGERQAAAKEAKKAGAIFLALKIDELTDAGIKENPVDRCYRCKKFLFQKIKELADKLEVSVVMEGTNEDDLHVWRPGIRAVRELKILSPLADAELTKKEIRQFAKEYHISVSNKPSMPCLATRFPYGTELSYEKLKRVDQAERYLRNLGLYNVRVRIHDDTARIEVDPDSFACVIEHRESAVSYLKQLGYSYVTLDLEGFRSGSMDIHIQKEKGGF